MARPTVKARYHWVLERPPKVCHVTCAKFGPIYPVVQGSGHADGTSAPRSLAPTAFPRLLSMPASLSLRLLLRSCVLPLRLSLLAPLPALTRTPLLTTRVCNRHLRPRTATLTSFLKALGLRSPCSTSSSLAPLPPSPCPPLPSSPLPALRPRRKENDHACSVVRSVVARPQPRCPSVLLPPT